MRETLQNLTAADLKKFAVQRGADLVGIASIDRFDGAPAHLHPAKTMLPTVKSIVVIAKRIARGTLRGNLEGTNFTTYMYYGYFLHQHRYTMYKLDYEVACFIERHGWEAVPSQGTGAHFRIAAFLAGLGQIGWHQLLITPQFGPCQRLGLIATEAELEPDPIFEGKLCDPEDCGYRCVLKCPNKAIPRKDKITVRLAGKTIEFSNLNLDRCIPDCIRATKHSPFIQKEIEVVRRAPPGSINEVIDCYKMLYRHVGFPAFVMRGASGCIEACIEYLEESGKIRKYKYPLIRRKPWSL